MGCVYFEECFKRVLLICEPASDASHGASHASHGVSHASHESQSRLHYAVNINKC